MADSKLSALTELAAAPAVDDELYIRDISEAAAAESKRITVGNLANYLYGTAGTFTAAQTAQITDAGTNTVVYPLTVDHQSSGTPAAGIGSGIAFKAETSAGNTETGATIEAVTTDVTGASEDFDVVVKTMVAGAAAAERFRISGTNSVSFPALSLFGDTTTGWYRNAANQWTWASGGNPIFSLTGGVVARMGSNGQFVWASTATSVGTTDTGLTRNSAGVIRASSGGAEIRGFLGGGAAVASAAALPVPTGRVFHVTGTTSVTSITSTNFGAGCVITMIFDDSLTFTHGNNIILAGAANFSATANDTLTMIYDGTNWYEVCRSVN